MDGARVLVIRFSSFGDIVLTTPVVRALKDQLEGRTEVHYLTKAQYASILESNPNVDHVHRLEDSLTETLNRLEEIDFDFIIDLHNNYRTRLTKRRLKTLSFTVDKANIRKWLMVNAGMRSKPIPHIVDRYLDTLKGFGVKDDKLGLEFFVPPKEMVTPSTYGVNRPFVVLVTGGNHSGKVMTRAMIERTISALNAQIVLLGDKSDKERISGLDKDYDNVVDLCGALTFNQSASFVAQAEVVISGDTGLMHVAAAFHKKIVSVWGCTSPLLGMSPYRAHNSSVMIEPEGRRRRPCSKLGNRCKYGADERCITTIQSLRIAEAATSLLNDKVAND